MARADIQKRNQILGAIAGVGLAYAAYLFFDFHSNAVPTMQAERGEKEQEIQNLQAELRRLNDFAKNIQVIKGEFRELNIQLESALEHMPRTFNLPVLLRRLNMLAQNSGIDLINFKPAKEESPVPGQFYATASIEVQLRGSFTQTLVFLDQMSRLKRIVNVEKLAMRAVAGNSQRSGTLVADTSAIIRTYRFSE